MKAFLQPLSGFTDLKWDLQKNRGILEVSGTLDSQKANLIAALAEDFSAVLIITAEETGARELHEDYRLYDRDVIYYPARDLIFYQADLSGNLLTRQRMKGIQALAEREKTTIITSTGGCMEYLLPFRVLKNHILTIENEGELDLQEISRKLSGMGYERCGQVEAAGQFAIRGGILDIYSLTEEVPFRVELWGDEIDSIRSFDPESQRSIENLQKITIYPASEEIGRDPSGDRDDADFWKHLTDTILDYLPENSLVVLDEPSRILESAKTLSDEFEECMERRLEAGQVREIETHRFMNATQLQYLLNRCNTLSVNLMDLRREGWELTKKYSMTVKQVSSYNNQFPLLLKDLKNWKKNGSMVVLLSASRTRGRRLASDLAAEGMNAFYSEEEERLLQPGEILVTVGSLRKGFEYPLQKFVMITESDIFGREQKKKKKQKTKYSGQKIQTFAELSPGDYVVHENHGLGIYRGIEKVEMDHVIKDYIKIEYTGGSSLYIPATGLESLQKYAGSDAAKKPKLNRLGGQEWKKTKSRVRGAVADIAKNLVSLYAIRQSKEGYAYNADTLWQREFEEMFPFEETEDQLAAIEATKKDMESHKIMDRLICGDVGYGKTEIAIRAAFKAVQENKQVVLLAPTTILAQQHYNTFVQRMQDFPVRIDLLCRFRSPAQQKKTLEDLRKGMVDIVIGTHRVLSKDVVFKDLGLLIVDEEQRFGVAHKERIKEMKKDVDVLTLTATPIPRTLHMSLIGIRDMSVLEEPPLDRLPIQTYVMEYDEELVREAISRELARDGQVYYVYNRVNNIADVAGRIARLVPQANVAFAHGQMKERELEQIMYSFIAGEIDVLVSTTIIETGMDISNVNTMIVHDADKMGLSQLYQLRGRVGRTNRTAYAFLMYRKDKILKEVAEKRLHAIREFTDLGSGVKIAMRDLEIRGAGNLLGAEQHGHMEAVGYDLYCKMLSEAVQEEKGIHSIGDLSTSLDLSIDAFIPPDYIPGESQKLEIYKRIASVENREEGDDMLDELTDRFGDPPRSVRNLVAAAELKSLAHTAYVTELKQHGTDVQITLYENARLDVSRIPALLDQYGRKLNFKIDANPYFLFHPEAPGKKKGTILEQVRSFIMDLRGIVLQGDTEAEGQE